MSPSSLGDLALTLGVYAVAMAVWRRGARHPLLNPTLLAILAIAGVLLATGRGLAAYQRDAAPVSLLLGPAVVALAVPIYRHAEALRARARILVTALVVGSMATIGTTLVIAAWLGGTSQTLLSLAPKSATAAVAMAISAQTGGVAALTAVVAIAAGIIGAVAGPPLLDALRIRDPLARGLGMGLASHGIGTARAFQEGEATGTAAGLAMGLNAILTAVIVPLLLAVCVCLP